MNHSSLAAAVQALASGAIIAYPTETVYGLGVDPWQEAAVNRLATLKGRPLAKGFILLVHGPEDLARLVHPLPKLAPAVMAAFWPGPLTLLLPAHPDLPPWLGGQEIALRWSPHPLVTELLKRWPHPLISTSANPTGHPPFRTPAQVTERWGSSVAVVLGQDHEKSIDSPLPSTILRLEDAAAQIIRPGVLASDELLRLLPDLPIVTSA